MQRGDAVERWDDVTQDKTIQWVKLSSHSSVSVELIEN